LRVPIDDDPPRLARRRDRANRKLWIVLLHRPDPGEDRACARAPTMAIGTRGFAGDPFRFAARERGPPVEACATFIRTHGRPRVIRDTKPTF
jgi:hypothetical protein